MKRTYTTPLFKVVDLSSEDALMATNDIPGASKPHNPDNPDYFDPTIDDNFDE